MVAGVGKAWEETGSSCSEASNLLRLARNRKFESIPLQRGVCKLSVPSRVRASEPRRSDLRGTNLSQSNLSGAHLEGANLFKAVLDGANCCWLQPNTDAVTPVDPNQRSAGALFTERL
jgi:hypothetical protein